MASLYIEPGGVTSIDQHFPPPTLAAAAAAELKALHLMLISTQQKTPQFPAMMLLPNEDEI